MDIGRVSHRRQFVSFSFLHSSIVSFMWCSGPVLDIDIQWWENIAKDPIFRAPTA